MFPCVKSRNSRIFLTLHSGLRNSLNSALNTSEVNSAFFSYACQIDFTQVFIVLTRKKDIVGTHSLNGHFNSLS